MGLLSESVPPTGRKCSAQVYPVGLLYGPVPPYHSSMHGTTAEASSPQLQLIFSVVPFPCTFYGSLMDHSHGARPMDNALRLM